MEADTKEFFEFWPTVFCKTLHYGLGFISFLVLVIINISPYWLEYPAEANNFTMGVWTYCLQKKCAVISETSVYLSLARAFLIVAVVCCLTALITSWSPFSQCLKEKSNKAKLSFVTYFIAAICILSTLLIIYTKLRTLMNAAEPLSLHQDFFLGCVVFVLFFILGMVNLSGYINLVSAQKKAATQITPAEEAPLQQ